MPNIVILSGRLTRDPELKHTPQGTSLCTFSIAFDCGWGERKKTVYKDCTAWGQQAEFIAGHFTKGKAICIQGALDEERWVDKATGKDRSKTVIKVDKAEFFGYDKPPKDEGQAGGEGEPREQRPASRPTQAAAPRQERKPDPKPDPRDEPVSDDDLPF